MEIVVTARHTDVSVRFRRHLDEKLAKVAQLAPRALRLEVGVSHEVNKRQAHTCERIELTLLGKGPVVRAEACADDPYVALDLATTKLMERLRRAVDRRKLHRGRHAPATVRGGGADEPVAVTALDGAGPEPVAPDGSGALADAAPRASGRAVVHPPVAGSDGDVATEYAMGESPVVIRDKVHVARPMSLEDALVEMELVGHDFFLFTDDAAGCPSVVYRRRGWSYGVIRLAGSDADADRITEVISALASSDTPEQQDRVGDPVPAG